MGSFSLIAAVWIVVGFACTGCGYVTESNPDAERLGQRPAEDSSTGERYYRMTARTLINGQRYALEVDHAKTISPTRSIALANAATTFFSNEDSWWQTVGIVYIRIEDEVMSDDFADNPFVESFDTHLCIPGFTVNVSKIPTVTCALDPALDVDEMEALRSEK